MKYRVIEVETGRDVTNDANWTLTPGRCAAHGRVDAGAGEGTNAIGGEGEMNRPNGWITVFDLDGPGKVLYVHDPMLGGEDKRPVIRHDSAGKPILVSWCAECPDRQESMQAGIMGWCRPGEKEIEAYWGHDPAIVPIWCPGKRMEVK